MWSPEGTRPAVLPGLGGSYLGTSCPYRFPPAPGAAGLSLSPREKITRALVCRVDRVIPLAVEVVPVEGCALFEVFHLPVADLDALGVVTSVEFGGDGQAGAGADRGDRVHDDFVAGRAADRARPGRSGRTAGARCLLVRAEVAVGEGVAGSGAVWVCGGGCAWGGVGCGCVGGGVWWWGRVRCVCGCCCGVCVFWWLGRCGVVGFFAADQGRGLRWVLMCGGVVGCWGWVC